ncbi:AraC family transcriptional regulator [Streptomyces sp. F63]|uniref:helix-turn-helix domain-containing protein n=1 Tax=Streptomyces sp. F63 TaxID=2824887 RepID=UPI001B3680E6|nr:helix-turn-helix domain-containing protein [Streptomyces sp. F63]MBQ0983697.1 AraC family transcriptional regulator [Streptomyces sp. F63]
MAGPRRDTRGIVDAPELFARVRFRRRLPYAEPLRRYVEHYWLIDWDLDEPYVTHVVPHPSVNLVFQRYGNGTEPGPGAGSGSGFGELAGIGLELFTRKLAGAGRVCGVQFRPGGFRPFAPGRPVSHWTGRRLPHTEVFPDPSGTAAGTGTAPGAAGGCGLLSVPGSAGAPAAVLEPAEEDERIAALDAFLLAAGPEPDPRADLAMDLVHRIRTDRSVRRVAEFAAAEGVSVRTLQRLFTAYVGVGPKWVLLRYRIHEALERATGERAVDWPRLAAELGYSDQAHLVRDFTATVGVPPTAYAKPDESGGGRPGPRPRPA